MTIRPLTRRNADGVLYERTQRVEEQIVEALAMAPAALVERARIQDYRAADYLQEECLVYLIREYHRQGQCALVDDLSAVLIDRVTRIVGAKLWILGRELATEAFADVVADIFPAIVDMESDAADFAQVRFRFYVERRATSAFRHYRCRAEEAALFADGEDDAAVSVQDQPDVDGDAVEDAAIARGELDEALPGLAVIEEPYRTAFILRHFGRWPIEHKDPDIPTISGRFGRDPRTIRNWLKKAEQALEAWRGVRV